MTLIFDPISNKNLREGSKNYEKMLRKIASGNFSRKNWTKKRREALVDLQINHVPRFLANEQQKRREAARLVAAGRTSSQKQAIVEKAKETRRLKKAAEERENAAMMERLRLQKEKRSAAAKKAAQTRKANQQVADYAIEWNHLLYWCEMNTSPFYSDRDYTEGDRFFKAKNDHRYAKVQDLRRKKGAHWMRDIAQQEDDFEEEHRVFGRQAPQHKKNENFPHFREALSQQSNHVFKGVRGKMTPQKAQQLIEEYEETEGYLAMYRQNQYNDFIRLETYVFSIINVASEVKLEDMLLFDERKDLADGIPIHPDGIPQGRCLIKAIRDTWGYSSQNRKGCREIMDDQWLMQALRVESLDNGASAKNMPNLAFELLKLGYGASYYMIDRLRNFIARNNWSSECIEEKSKVMKKIVGPQWSFKWTLPALYGWVYDNHFAEIHDVKFQQSLRERVKAEMVQSEKVNTGKKKKKQREQDATEGEEKDIALRYILVETNGDITSIVKYIHEQESTGISNSEERRVYILRDFDESHLIESVFLEYIKQTLIIPNVRNVISSKASDCCIKDIILPGGSEIRLDNNYAKRKEIAEKLAVDFHDKSLPGIASEVLQKTYPNFKKSMLSRDLLRILESDGKPSIFYGRVNMDEKVNMDPDKYVAIDKPRCYGTSWYDMPLPYPVFSFYDEVEEYCPIKSDDGKSAGLYFIKTDNVIPCEGDGWYTNVILDKCKAENIPHEVTHMILASGYLPGDYFRKYIDEIKEKLGRKDSKLPVNAMIGIFGMKVIKKHFQNIYTPDEKEAISYFQKWQSKGEWRATIAQKFQKEFNGLDLYNVTCSRTVKTFESHRPIRKQIIDYANCLLYDMIMDTVGSLEKVLAIKTDCIVVRKDDVDITKVCKYRVEDGLPLVQKDLNLPRKLNEPVVLSHWMRKIPLTIPKNCNGAEMLLSAVNGQSARIQAPAGHGKSYLLKSLQGHLGTQGRKVLLVAPTNAAADNVKGKTIHKGLCIGGADDIAHLTNNLPDDILIDEISQIPSYLWNTIYIYKQMGCRFFLFGDANQLPPVEPWEDCYSEDYLETKTVADIADGYLVFLTENYRFLDDPSNKMHEIVQAVQTSDMPLPDFVKRDATATTNSLNIAFTNRMCHYVNDLNMKRDEEREKNKARILKCPRIPKDPKTQDCIFIKGSPLISRKAMRNQGVIKGTRWSISSWNTTEVICEKADLTDGIMKCSIPRDKFQKFFLSGYCTTVHKAQGQTFNKPFTIHEVEKMSKRMLYTAVSRAKHSKFIQCSSIRLRNQMEDPKWMAQLKESLSWVEGCTFVEFLTYIQQLLNGSKDLRGMSWNDYRWNFEIDHIKPVSQGGSNHYKNLTPLDISENRRKQKRTNDAVKATFYMK